MIQRRRRAVRDFARFKPYLSTKAYTEARALYLALLDLPVSKANRTHCHHMIFPYIAVYKTLSGCEQDALAHVHAIMTHQKVAPANRLLRRIFRLPGLYRLFPQMVRLSLKTTYKESGDGFQRKVIVQRRDCICFHMLRCPYQRYCAEQGVPELCDVFCTSDETVMADVHPRLIFERSQTLGRSGECCDFCYRVI